MRGGNPPCFLQVALQKQIWECGKAVHDLWLAFGLKLTLRLCVKSGRWKTRPQGLPAFPQFESCV